MLQTVVALIVTILSLPLTGALLQIALILVLTLAAFRALALGAGRVERRVERAARTPEQVARLKTLVGVWRGTALVVLLVLAVLMVLSTVGISIAPLLAGAGVVGLAVSLGAQTLIKDYIGGVLILLENQFVVGDSIQVGQLAGAVERMTLRATYLRDGDGRLHLVPNGDIRSMSNFSLQWSQANVTLYVGYDADMAAVLQAMNAALECAQAEPGVRDVLLEPPQVQTWAGLKDWGVQVSLSARTRAGQQGGATVALRRCAVEALQAAGIQPALPAQRVIVEQRVS